VISPFVAEQDGHCVILVKCERALSAQGYLVGATTVGRLLHAIGYSRHGTAKTTEGARRPDRDAQFDHINATATAFLDDGQPVISVDTKAREWIGNRDRPGRVWRAGKDPFKGGVSPTVWDRGAACVFSTAGEVPDRFTAVGGVTGKWILSSFQPGSESGWLAVEGCTRQRSSW
jgi:hypothetical protein